MSESHLFPQSNMSKVVRMKENYPDHRKNDGKVGAQLMQPNNIYPSHHPPLEYYQGIRAGKISQKEDPASADP
jgi:hypothetical protein